MSQTNILTIDVEEWYHGLDLGPDATPSNEFAPQVPHQIEHLLALLFAADTRATFFVLGCVAERHPEMVRAIDQAGHEIATHGYAHEFVYHRTPVDFAADVARSLDVLRALTDQPICGYRAPYFSITHASRWALPILRDLGIVYDSSVFPILNHRYGIPGAPRVPHLLSDGLLELPPATCRIGPVNVPCGGGAYFRLWPYVLTRWFLRCYAQQAHAPAIFYLHPWELDPAHPHVQSRLTGSVRYSHYWYLDRTEARLRRLLRDFRFGSIAAVYPTLIEKVNNL